MVELKNDRLIKALLCQPVDKTPIWLMRQAGRYLPEYREVRERAGDFMTLCQTPELACEVTLQPLERFDLDAAIIFSDILVIPDAMGLGLHFFKGEGPVFEKPIREHNDIKNLPELEPAHDLSYVLNTIEHVTRELNGKVPLIGFSGSPWTLATYMIEGEASKAFNKIKKMLYEDSAILHELLSKLAQAVTRYLNAQIEAGVNAVMIFDTWGGILTSPDYHEFSLEYMQQIISGLTHKKKNQQIPIILFTKYGGQWLEWLAESGCDAVSLDWTVELDKARKLVGQRVALQGNMEPAILYSNPERIRHEVDTLLKQYGPGPGHVFNLGHGILPDVPPENVSVLVDSVHELSEQYHLGD